MPFLNWKSLYELDNGSDKHENTIARDLAVDVYEGKKEIIVKLYIPGINPDKIDISVEHEHLHVSGSREVEKETETHKAYIREIRRGEFERIIPLPKEVDSSKAQAQCKEGVLTIVLPIKEGKDTPRIKISKK
jgi:HSP20 family protein